MRKVGAFLTVAGVASFLLAGGGYNLKVLFWVDSFGPEGGMFVRALLVIGGGLLYVLGKPGSAGSTAGGSSADLTGTTCAQCGTVVKSWMEGRACDRCEAPVHPG